MKKISDMILRTEEILAGGMLVLISVLVFLSAVARTVGMPVNWAQDVSLLAFGWLTFIGSDIIARAGSLIRIDMLSNKLPAAVQKVLAVVFDVLMVLFLLILIVYGFLLVCVVFYRKIQGKGCGGGVVRCGGRGCLCSPC